jgi:2-polyprenyl-3-methyl-5-hydroxy-6-metoxy-1,4-benzoquinol methylase
VIEAVEYGWERKVAQKHIWYQEMVANEIVELNPMRLMHIGCGPWPISAMLHTLTGCDVTCVDRSAEAIKMASAASNGMTAWPMKFQHADGRDITDFEGYDTVLLAVTAVDPILVSHLHKHVPPHITLAYRTAHGDDSPYATVQAPGRLLERPTCKGLTLLIREPL